MRATFLGFCVPKVVRKRLMRFILLYGNSEEHEITTECQVGRREGNLKFSDEHLSGVHGKFYIEDGKLFVMDLGSSNGTRVNGKKISKHVPHEVLHEDKVEMGTQLLEVKISEPTTSIHIELPNTEVEKTSIEVLPSISLIREEELKEAEPQEFIASVQDSTHAEVSPANEAISLESAQNEVEAVLPVEGTHIETESEVAVAPDSVAPSNEEGTYVEVANTSENTYVEVAATLKVPEAVANTPAASTLAESSSKSQKGESTHIEFIPPQKFQEEVIKPHFVTPILEEESQGDVPQSIKEKIIYTAHSLHRSFGTTQIVVVSAICLGVLAFFFISPSKNSTALSVERTQASTEATQVSPPTPPVVETPVAAESPAQSADSVIENTPAAVIPPPTEVTSEAETTENTENVVPNSEVTEPVVEIVAETPVEKLEVAPLKKAPKKVVAKKTAPKKAVTRSKARDPYNEVALLKTLTRIKSEAKRSSSYRVKAALEVDAAEAVTQHYQKIKDRINNNWKKARTLASDEKQKVKTVLQSQLIAVNNRERAVKARLSLYIHGKLNTPL